MRVLILEATGFLGQAVIDALRDTPFELRATYGRSGPPPRQSADVEWVCVDLERPRTIAEAAEGCVAALFVGAPLPAPRQALADALQTGIRHVRHVLEGLRQHRSLQRLIYTSTAATLGLNDDPDDDTARGEQHRHLPGSSPYPLPDVAFAMESEILAANSLALTTSVLLPSLMLGPGHLDAGLNPTLLAMARGRVPVVPPGAFAPLDLRDAAKAHAAALQRARPGQRYTLAGPASSIEDLLDALQDLTQAPPPRVALPAALPPSLVKRAAGLMAFGGTAGDSLLNLHAALHTLPAHLDTHKAELELSFEARPLTQTLRDTVEWFRDQGLL